MLLFNHFDLDKPFSKHAQMHLTFNTFDYACRKYEEGAL